MGRFQDFMRARVPGLFLASRRIRHALLARRAPEQVFTAIYRTNAWRGAASRSGQGSDLAQTEAIRRALPPLLSELECRSLLDVPCGDYLWLRETPLAVDYTGGDIVAELVEENRRRYGDAHHRFITIDLIHDVLPVADVVLSRDCLVHFSFAHAHQALANIRRSGARYALLTTFVAWDRNEDIPTGAWRPLNLERAPFNLPPPLRRIDEECPAAGHRDKHLGLWRVADLPR